MAVNRARGGFGTKLYIGDGATPTEGFTLVSDTLDFSGGDESAIIEDATHMDSPNGWAEKVAVGVKEISNLTFDVHFVPGDTVQAGMRADLAAGTLRNFRLLLPGGTHRVEFSAYVESMGRSYPVKGKAMTPISLAISGEPVVALAS